MHALSELSDPRGFFMPNVDVVILDYGRVNVCYSTLITCDMCITAARGA